jgi:uncharacterized protein YutE (UPF0331/DUF86 family)
MTDCDFDEQRLGKIFSDIDRYLRDLENLRVRSLQDLDEQRTYYAVSMVLYILLNRIFDLGSEIVMACNLGVPVKYREIFILLRQNGLIGESMEQELIRMVVYRNLLSHEYHGLKNTDIMNLIGRVSVIRDFVAMMRAVVVESSQTHQ